MTTRNRIVFFIIPSVAVVLDIIWRQFVPSFLLSNKVWSCVWLCVYNNLQWNLYCTAMYCTVELPSSNCDITAGHGRSWVTSSSTYLAGLTSRRTASWASWEAMTSLWDWWHVQRVCLQTVNPWRLPIWENSSSRSARWMNGVVCT